MSQDADEEKTMRIAAEHGPSASAQYWFSKYQHLAKENVEIDAQLASIKEATQHLPGQFALFKETLERIKDIDVDYDTQTVGHYLLKNKCKQMAREVLAIAAQKIPRVEVKLDIDGIRQRWSNDCAMTAREVDFLLTDIDTLGKKYKEMVAEAKSHADKVQELLVQRAERHDQHCKALLKGQDNVSGAYVSGLLKAEELADEIEYAPLCMCFAGCPNCENTPTTAGRIRQEIDRIIKEKDNEKSHQEAG